MWLRGTEHHAVCIGSLCLQSIRKLAGLHKRVPSLGLLAENTLTETVDAIHHHKHCTYMYHHSLPALVLSTFLYENSSYLMAKEKVKERYGVSMC